MEDNIDEDDDISECQSEGGDNGSDEDVDKKIRFEVGQEFKNVTHFREVLVDYEVQEGFHALRQKNEKSKVTAICEGKGCIWKIHASPLARDGITYVIKTLIDKHTCKRSGANKHINSVWIAKKLAPNLRVNPYMNNKVIEHFLKEKYNLESNRMRLYRAKWRAREEFEGSHVKSYKKVEKYGEMVREKNKENAYVIQYQNGCKSGYEIGGVPVVLPQFKHLFICFDACKQGFLKGCRPFLGLDGCHLKGAFGGVLVATVSVEGNNGIFPVAYGVVQSEDKDSWLFFFYHLRETLERNRDTVTTPDIPITFMTDKQKGLIEAISIIYPEANHRHCSRHLYNNFKKQFGGGPALRGYFWATIKAYNVYDFQKAMNGIKEEKKEAYDWLMKTPVQMWARHAFDHRAKSDHITNNMTESFNQWIAPIWSKPILTMIDQIRLKLIPPVAGGDKYEVQDGSHRYVVDLGNLTCECGIYMATGLPCRHVGACTQFNKVPVLHYCHAYYTTKTYLLADGGVIDPLSDPNTLEDTNLLPPPLKWSIGRPNRSRRREPDEARKEDIRKRSTTVRCSKCHSFNHNKRTCKGGPVKGKRPSTSKTIGVKRKASSNIHVDTTPSQRVTRSSQQSQQSSTSALTTEQDKVQKRMEVKAAKLKAKRDGQRKP
ncbi:uncharacterized protein LOC122668643 [Telopea speciosissima]|uniref:uncharacterized protein LOC122668643 n=1 Tax=Telopea speciosissima TaxID=54955 RepID=UPI001CC5B325|nr:uncharacterized protein LOC122668643 [Telopea speciosissima]